MASLDRVGARLRIGPTVLIALVALAVMAALVSCSPDEPLRPGGPTISPETPGAAPATVTVSPDRDAVTGIPATPRPRAQVPAAECPDDNERRNWYYTPASAPGGVPTISADVARMLGSYGGLWRTPTSDRVVYLTFDAGYEAGYTSRILDTLAAEQIPAAFFVTRSYIEAEPDLVRRMAAEGHTVANHSDIHPSMPTLAGAPDAFEREFVRCAEAYRTATGREMPPLFRPPMGEYSARTLCMTQQLGYTSVFWSFAHRDWLLDDQPTVVATIDRVVRGSHPGAILLLHAVSASNTDALPEIVRRLRVDGYQFGNLEELAQ